MEPIINEKNIYTQLLEFQKLDISIKKNALNPHFKKNYADLNEVLDKVKKPLLELGVIIIFKPQPTCLETILFHVESLTWINSIMTYIDIANAQKLLACNTYFRRGSLVSLLSLEDDDDDGNKAVEVVKPAMTAEQLDKAKLAIVTKAVTIEQVKLKYKLTKEQENFLCQI